MRIAQVVDFDALPEVTRSTASWPGRGGETSFSAFLIKNIERILEFGMHELLMPYKDKSVYTWT